MSDEFDAAIARTEWQRDKADWVKSMANVAAGYQHRAEVAEAALARVKAILGDPSARRVVDDRLVVDDIRAALKEPK